MPVAHSGIQTSADGSPTLYSTRYGQYYHSLSGAWTQSRHVFVDGSRLVLATDPRVLEIGFGCGLNFLTSVAACRDAMRPLTYQAYEFDPLPREPLEEALAPHPAARDPAWLALLAAWPPEPELQVQVEGVELKVCRADATTVDFSALSFSAIFLDGFSPAVNAEVWTDEFIARLSMALAPGGWLVTYSAAGHVRRALAAAGLVVSRRPGAAGKRECLAAHRPRPDHVDSAG